MFRITCVVAAANTHTTTRCVPMAKERCDSAIQVSCIVGCACEENIDDTRPPDVDKTCTGPTLTQWETSLMLLNDCLPTLERRHKVRIRARDPTTGGFTDEAITDFFLDINQLSRMILAVDYKSLRALELFASYMDILNCPFDAWKARLSINHLITKEKCKPMVDTTRPSSHGLTLTTLGAVVRIHHQPYGEWQIWNDDLALLGQVRCVKPTQTVKCRAYDPEHIEQILGKDLILSVSCKNNTVRRKGMMAMIYFLGDTLARKDEPRGVDEWHDDTWGKIGVCSGGYILIEGPIRDGKDFNYWMGKFLYENLDLCLHHKHRQEWASLPGRSFTIVHEDSRREFELLYEKEPNLTLQNNSWVHVAHDWLTGQWVFHCKNVTVLR